ncbi:MAG: response regulator, partial [Candidatus Eisenbacteria bacterium]|nr:response regulator [Candidatus Eisenbacteria bacterium]
MAYNVLIVDDSAVMRTMLRRVLAMAGIDVGEVHEAPNGQVGLECLERSWIDLALIDINMPVMNGEELIQRIRANPSTHDLAVIVVSSK